MATFAYVAPAKQDANSTFSMVTKVFKSLNVSDPNVLIAGVTEWPYVPPTTKLR